MNISFIGTFEFLYEKCCLFISKDIDYAYVTNFIFYTNCIIYFISFYFKDNIKEI